MNFRKTLSALTVSVLAFAAAPPSARAVTTTLVTTVASDGSVRDVGPDGTFDGLFIHFLGATVMAGVEVRGIMEFAVSGIPAGAMITGVEFEAESWSLPDDAEFFLYAGNATVDVTDATGGSPLVTFAVPIFGNLFTQALPIAGFQTLFDNAATHFGLRFQVAIDSTVVFVGVEDAARGAVPMLRVTFDAPVANGVPEPVTGVLGVMGLVVLGCAARRRV